MAAEQPSNLRSRVSCESSHHPTREEIAALIDAGDFRVVVEAVFPLHQARQAYARAAQGGLSGKIALCIPG